MHSIFHQIWETQQWPQDWKGKFSFQSQRKAMPFKECSNYHTIALISHASKVILNILHIRLQQYVNHEFQMFKLNLGNAEEPEIKLPTSIGSLKKQESSRKKHLLLLYLLPPKPLTVWITTNCGKFWKRWAYQTTWPASRVICLQVKIRTGNGTTDWFQIWEGVHQDVYFQTAYLTYIQSTLCETPRWMKHKLESRLPVEISITSYMQMTPPLCQKVRKN